MRLTNVVHKMFTFSFRLNNITVYTVHVYGYVRNRGPNIRVHYVYIYIKHASGNESEITECHHLRGHYSGYVHNYHTIRIVNYIIEIHICNYFFDLIRLRTRGN